MQQVSGRDTVTCVIATHNNGNTIKRCIRSLLRGSIIPAILIVDYGSTDGMPEEAERFLEVEKRNGSSAKVPDFHLIRLGVNTGRAHALNTGIHLTTTPYVMTISPDVMVSRRFVEKLLNGMRAKEAGHKMLGVQGLIVAAGSDAQKQGAGYVRQSALSAQAARASAIRSAGWGMHPGFLPFRRGEGHSSCQTLGAQTGGRRGMRRGGGLFWRERNNEWILASDISASLLSMDALKEIGLMDERLFGCFEDLDLGIRAACMGYKSALVPNAVCKTLAPAGYTPFEQKVMVGNLVYMGYKYNRPRLAQKVTEWLLCRGAMLEADQAPVEAGGKGPADAEAAGAGKELAHTVVAKAPAHTGAGKAPADAEAAGAGKELVHTVVAKAPAHTGAGREPTDKAALDAAIERGRMMCFHAEMERMERDEMEMSVTKLPLQDEFCMDVAWSAQTTIYPLWLGERMESLPEMLRYRMESLTEALRYRMES